MQKQPRSKQHHYVPRNYLRRFAADGKRVEVFDKSTGKQFPSAVERVGAEPNFSGFQVVEKVLSEAEYKYKSTLDNILINLENGIFTQENKRELAPFLALQMLRTRSARDMVGDLELDVILEMLRRDDQSIFKVTIPQEHVQYQHLRIMLNPTIRQKLALCLHNDNIWIIGKNETDQPLWTSDSPISTTSRQFALNPKYLLILLKRRSAARYAGIEGGIIQLTEQQARAHNILQIAQCTRHVFSPSPHFSIAEEFRRENPEACDPGRPRSTPG